MKIPTYINQQTLVFLITALFCLLLFVIPPAIAFAHDGGEPGHHNLGDSYESLSPFPGTENVDTGNPGSYFATLFTIFISVISLLAVIKLMLCGFQYMTSEAISSKENAKKCIWAVVGGIFLILLSYLILVTINEDLTKLNFDKIKERVQQSARIQITPGGDSVQPPIGGQPPVQSVVTCINDITANSCQINASDDANCINAGCQLINVLNGNGVCNCGTQPPEPLPPPPPGSGWCYLYGTPSPACFSSEGGCNNVRSSDPTRTDITERCVLY